MAEGVSQGKCLPQGTTYGDRRRLDSLKGSGVFRENWLRIELG
jgi:hypothetical protein